jgi:hypothetical protein
MGAIWDFIVRLVHALTTPTEEKKPASSSSSSSLDSSEEKKLRIPKDTRQDVWKKYFADQTQGVCYVCDFPLPNKGWHCSHVISEDKGGVISLENLRPCCAGCNLSMGNCNLYAYAVAQGKKGTRMGMAYRNSEGYFRLHPEQRNDKRTNNWGHK